jgi:hypothetical protein
MILRSKKGRLDRRAGIPYFTFTSSLTKVIKEVKMAKVPDIKENVNKCVCGGCPSYSDCMRDNNEILYCAREKSQCDVTRKGCLCGACPLAAEYGLDKYFYCIIGAAE